jgi:hypothetical protein
LSVVTFTATVLWAAEPPPGIAAGARLEPAVAAALFAPAVRGPAAVTLGAATSDEVEVRIERLVVGAPGSPARGFSVAIERLPSVRRPPTFTAAFGFAVTRGPVAPAIGVRLVVVVGFAVVAALVLRSTGCSVRSVGRSFVSVLTTRGVGVG